MTFAFGMHQKFKTVYQSDDNVLRMALMEKDGQPPERSPRTSARSSGSAIAPNVVVAIGNRIVTNSFDRWLPSCPASTRTSTSTGSTPSTCSSTRSVRPNGRDRQRQLQQGEHRHKRREHARDPRRQRAADIYFGEYLRLYSHYAFREAVKFFTEKQKAGSPEEWKPQYLIDNDSWMDPYFDPADPAPETQDAAYFAGPMSVG